MQNTMEEVREPETYRGWTVRKTEDPMNMKYFKFWECFNDERVYTFETYLECIEFIDEVED